jgi:hypothetical protein
MLGGLMFAEPSLNRMRQSVGWMMILGSTLLSVYGLVGIAATPFTTPIGALIGVIAGLFSVIAPIVATWSPRVAARIYLWIAPTDPLLVPLFHVPFGYGILGRDMARWNPQTAIATAAVVFVGSLVIPCFFWRWAVRRGWPGLLAEGPLSRFPKLFATVGFVTFIGLSLVALLLSLNFPWRPIVGDCGGGPLLSEGAPLGLVTASVLFVGPRSYRGQSLWSVVRVDHVYSPKAWAMPNLVILRGGFRVEGIGRQYFVEGQRSYAPLGRFLPIIEPLDCGHTKPLEDAAIELRVLRDGPPKSGIRLIGQVYKGNASRSVSRTPVPGIEVSIDGPSGKIESVTDPQGVYDLVETLPGRYLIRSATAHETIEIEAKTGDVHIVNLYLPCIFGGFTN